MVFTAPACALPMRFCAAWVYLTLMIKIMYVCDHSQEAERVMETFNSHLHLPVTCIDHSKVITGGGRKKGGGTRRAHTVICLSPTGR